MSRPSTITPAPPPTLVVVVDDDASIRRAVRRLLVSAGYSVETFGSAAELLAWGGLARTGCLVCDVRMPGVDGLELQRALRSLNGTTPIVFITAHGDIPTTVRAMKAGAVDFLPKPFDDEALLGSVRQSLRQAAAAHREHDELAALRTGLAALSPREREVFALVATGRLNKQIAAELGLSEKTVKVHRSRVMEKMQTRSLAELVRAADRLGLARPPLPDSIPETS